MAKIKKPEKKKQPLNPDAQGLFLIALGFLGFLSLYSFAYLEPSRNWLGFLGYAFSFGIDRLMMLRHGVPDIRLSYTGDLRFVQQF